MIIDGIFLPEKNKAIILSIVFTTLVLRLGGKCNIKFYFCVCGGFFMVNLVNVWFDNEEEDLFREF